MRVILSAAIAAAAICGPSSLAAAESVHSAGGPLQEGKLCWVSASNDLGYGFWTDCAPAPRMHHKKVK